MSGGNQYVVAAYAVIWFLVLAYVVMLGVICQKCCCLQIRR